MHHVTMYLVYQHAPRYHVPGIPACTTLPCTWYTSMHHVTMYLVYQHAPCYHVPGIPACTTLPCTWYTSMHQVTLYLVYQHAPSSLRIQSNMRFIPIFKVEQKSFVMTFFHIYIYASFPFNPWFPLKQINNNKQYKQSW